MNWIVNIENKPELRIVIKYDPLDDLLIFTGEYKFKNKWIVFSKETHSSNINLEEIQILLFNLCDKLNERIDIFNDLNESFKLINIIEIPED